MSPLAPPIHAAILVEARREPETASEARPPLLRWHEVRRRGQVSQVVVRGAWRPYCHRQAEVLLSEDRRDTFPVRDASVDAHALQKPVPRISHVPRRMSRKSSTLRVDVIAALLAQALAHLHVEWPVEHVAKTHVYDH